jgi:hypothetical protein
MFQISCDPSSGSTELCLTEITCSDSQIFCVCWLGTSSQLAGPYTHTPQVQDYAAEHQPSSRQNICESL